MPLSRRTDYGDARFAGCEVQTCKDLEQELQCALSGGFDFLLAPLECQCDVSAVHREGVSPIPNPPIARSEFLLNSTQWSSQVVGSVSCWIDPDSSDPSVRAASEAQLRKELGWAFHLSLQAVVMPTPKLFSPSYARIIQQILQSQHGHTQLWLRIPLVAPAVAAVEGTPEEEELLAQRDQSTRKRTHDPWEWWDTFRHLCDGSKELGAVVELGPSLPTPPEWRRWLGEPLRAVLVSTSAFITNKRGFPVLPKSHQDFLACMFSNNIQVVLTGDARHQCPADDPLHKWESSQGAGSAPEVAQPQSESKHALHLYMEYLMYLFKKLDEVPEQQLVEMSYRDYLQVPLQPLADNLESQTYEVFEKDATKYTTYEEAVFRALQDRAPGPDGVTVLMVVGAGRGPLVKASLRAAARAQRKLRVFAVEKNVNAIMHLRCLSVTEKWEGVVSIISHDMRTWAAPEQADIMVSELLGSFGDNELSPECLDGAQRFLKPDGVCIPQAYTSFIAPMTCSKLHNDCKAYKDLAHLETPYVVRLHRHFLMAAPLPVFEFAHPNCAETIDNSRHIELRFKRTADDPAATIHGFAGYFDAKLYRDVHLSIYPPTHTPDMFSWFPIYFPLVHPAHVPQGADITLDMWRCSDSAKVWYEWALVSPVQSHIHNPGGASQRLLIPSSFSAICARNCSAGTL